MRPERLLPRDLDIAGWLGRLRPGLRRQAVELLGEPEREALDRDWPSWAHDGQCPPPGDWSTWVVMAGRGFGKTLAGSNWLVAAIAGGEPLSLALVGATLEDARRVMVEGRSGLLAVADAWVEDWHPSLRRLRFRTGAEAVLFSGASPELLRGPEHHLAWCDELAKWERPQETWDMLQLGLRLGGCPRALVTTTPRPGPVLTAIMADPATVVTGGPSHANPHASPAWLGSMDRRYAGTRLGRQELGGELISDAPGALWWPELIERCRILPGTGTGTGRGTAAEGGGGGGGSPPPAPPDSAPGSPSPPSVADATATFPSRGGFVRLVVAVDPPSGDGTCGIIACARDAAGIAHVLADHSVAGRSAEGWARAVADAARIWGRLHAKAPLSPLVVAEANQGGRMVAAVLRTADPALRVKPVTASVGKAERAAPVAMLFEAGRIVLRGRFPELEAQLCGMIAGGGYEGPGRSPDRADAMVWALTELMLGPDPAEPRLLAL